MKQYLMHTVIIFITLIHVSFVHAIDFDKKIRTAYLAQDWAATLKILEEEISKVEKTNQSDRIKKYREFQSKYLLQAYIYAWKLNDYDKALEIYQNRSEHKQSAKKKSHRPNLEFMYIADIYEWKKEPSKAEEYYLKFLTVLNDLKKRERDDVSNAITDHLIMFVKYKIDSLNLNTGKELLLPQINLSSVTAYNTAIYPMLALIMMPAAEFEGTNAMTIGIRQYIQNSPANVGSMFFNYFLILSQAGLSIDESSEQIINAYLKKYPQSYCSLLLRHLFSAYYKENNQKSKADALIAELKGIAQYRNMAIILEPSQKFSSPEETWEFYRESLMDGNLSQALACHVPYDTTYKEIFNTLGLDELKVVAAEMTKIEKITYDSTGAKYRTIRRVDGQDITFYVYFENIGGEWKIVRY